MQQLQTKRHVFFFFFHIAVSPVKAREAQDAAEAREAAWQDRAEVAMEELASAMASSPAASGHHHGGGMSAPSVAPTPMSSTEVLSPRSLQRSHRNAEREVKRESELARVRQEREARHGDDSMMRDPTTTQPLTGKNPPPSAGFGRGLARQLFPGDCPVASPALPREEVESLSSYAFGDSASPKSPVTA